MVTSTSRSYPSTSWSLAALRLGHWCDVVIDHTLDNLLQPLHEWWAEHVQNSDWWCFSLLHVWITCRPCRPWCLRYRSETRESMEPSHRLDRLGRKRHPLGGLTVVVCCASDRTLFSLWAWIWILRGKGTFLTPYSWYVMIYSSRRHSVPVLTGQLTQFLPVLEDISCGYFNIRD